MAIRCILASPRSAELADFLEGLRAGGATVDTVTDGKAALSAVKEDAPELVVIDEGLPSHEPLALVMEVITANALVNTAVFTTMPDKEFHDKSEGFGVLRGLPLSPSLEDGKELAAQVVRVINLV